MDSPEKYEIQLEQMKRENDERREYLYGDTGLPGRLSRLEAQTEHLPSKGFIVLTVMIGFTLAAAIFGFQDQIVSLFPRP